MKPKILVYTGGSVETNAYLLPCADGTYLAVDAPEGLTDFTKENSLRISALLLTHGHYDHVWDTAPLCERHRCLAYAHPIDHEMILRPDYLRKFGIPQSYPLVKKLEPVDVPLHGQIAWSCAGHDFTVAHVPGHCPGHISFYLAQAALIFGGDVLFAGGVGRWDFPLCSRAELLDSIRNHFLTLPDETVVYPGHGPETTVGEERATNPYLR